MYRPAFRTSDQESHALEFAGWQHLEVLARYQTEGDVGFCHCGPVTQSPLPLPWTPDLPLSLDHLIYPSSIVPFNISLYITTVNAISNTNHPNPDTTQHNDRFYHPMCHLQA